MLSHADYENMFERLQGSRNSRESAEAFLERMRAIGRLDDETIVELEAKIEEHRQSVRRRGTDEP